MLLILLTFFLITATISGKSFSPGVKWPSGIVPYEIEASFTPENRTELELAFAEYHLKTCIRFTPKTDTDQDYILLRIDDSVCGEADTCKVGGGQEVLFGSQCRPGAQRRSVMVHELGHVLCMGHEQNRRDRDEYLDFPGCSPTEIPGIDTDHISISLYDYTSQMHGPCGTCEGGTPKNINIAGQCGSAVTEGLSVLDVDKLNDFYGCGGCHSYRYKKADNLSVDDINSLVSGETEGLETFLCRGSHSIGDIIPGVFYLDEMTCYVGFGGIETAVEDGEVLLWGEPEDGGTRPNLRWVASDRREIPEGAVAGGRTRDGETLFIVRALISIGQRNVYIPGKMHANTPYRAFTTFGGNEIPATDFDFLVCESDVKN